MNILIQLLFQVIPNRRKMPLPIKLQSKNRRSRITWRIPPSKTHSLPRADSPIHAARRDRTKTQHIRT